MNAAIVQPVYAKALNPDYQSGVAKKCAGESILISSFWQGFTQKKTISLGNFEIGLI
jgi:hypothetical protein